jgi:hypothetical protein
MLITGLLERSATRCLQRREAHLDSLDILVAKPNRLAHIERTASLFLKTSSQALAMFTHLFKSEAIFQFDVSVYNQLYSVRHALLSLKGCAECIQCPRSLNANGVDFHNLAYSLICFSITGHETQTSFLNEAISWSSRHIPATPRRHYRRQHLIGGGNREKCTILV